MAEQKITNKFTLEKMKKKNKKSIRVNKETGTITQGGKTYKNKEDYKKNKPASKKNTGSIFESPKSKAIRLSTESGKANTAATKKMYAAESMFKSAKARDEAKVTPGKARPFGEAKAAAEKADKDRFMWKGKSYFTTRGAAENRDKKKTEIAPKGSIKKKSNLDADTVASYKKRIKYMKDRKAKGKNFSAKNLKELEAKLAAN
jgi:hypothetical protein